MIWIMKLIEQLPTYKQVVELLLFFWPGQTDKVMQTYYNKRTLSTLSVSPYLYNYYVSLSLSFTFSTLGLPVSVFFFLSVVLSVSLSLSFTLALSIYLSIRLFLRKTQKRPCYWETLDKYVYLLLVSKGAARAAERLGENISNPGNMEQVSKVYGDGGRTSADCLLCPSAR